MLFMESIMLTADPCGGNASEPVYAIVSAWIVEAA